MLRRLLGALSLGLLAAFLAHAMVYGGSHVMGGGYGEVLRLLACFATLAALVAWLATGWASRGRLCDGTVIAARMQRLIPSAPVIAAAAIGWFAVAESIEGAHADAPILILTAALAVASVIVTKLAKIGLHAVASIVFGTRARPFVSRVPVWVPISPQPVFLAPAAHERRRFARPPPVGLSA